MHALLGLFTVACIVQGDQLDGLGGTMFEREPCLGGNHLSCNIRKEGGILVENYVACLLVHCCGHIFLMHYYIKVNSLKYSDGHMTIRHKHHSCDKGGGSW